MARGRAQTQLGKRKALEILIAKEIPANQARRGMNEFPDSIVCI